MPQTVYRFISNGLRTGGAENTNDGVIFKKDVVPGEAFAKMAGSGTTTETTVGSKTLKIDIALGQSKANERDMANAIAQSIGSPASGYATTGAPTFGDGRSSVATTWPADTEVTGAKHNYLVGGKEIEKTY